jgi:hypothetical protein
MKARKPGPFSRQELQHKLGVVETERIRAFQKDSKLRGRPTALALPCSTIHASCALWLLTAAFPGIAQPTVDSFTLMRVGTAGPDPGYDPLTNGAIIDLSVIGSSLNIRANTTPDTDFGSVAFSLTGATTTNRNESTPPWAMGGDTTGDCWSVQFHPGSHTLTATPSSSGGAIGMPLTVRFTVIDSWGGGTSLPPCPSAPFDGTNFVGRIAFSTDGNYNDPDDWAASPVALALIGTAGLSNQLVHFDYNCILPASDPTWEREHSNSVHGTALRYGLNAAVLHDCQRDLAAATNSIAAAVNASSATNPLYFVLAGPMDVPALGIAASDPAKRPFVYCISHNRWNDGYANTNLVRHNKRDVIPLGVKWIQIQDQNRLLSTSRYGRPAVPAEWGPWLWMSNSASTGVRFLWDCMQASTRPDCSDAGMAYFLLTGDESADPTKLKSFLEDRIMPPPLDPRPRIRIEAENFRWFDHYTVESSKARNASQRLSVMLTGSRSGSVRTIFDEPYAASGVYEVDVRYYDAGSGDSVFRLLINGKPQGASWTASLDNNTWCTRSFTRVVLHLGDDIQVEGQGDGSERAELDYVEVRRLSMNLSDDADPDRLPHD